MLLNKMENRHFSTQQQAALLRAMLTSLEGNMAAVANAAFREVAGRAVEMELRRKSSTLLAPEAAGDLSGSAASTRPPYFIEDEGDGLPVGLSKEAYAH